MQGENMNLHDRLRFFNLIIKMSAIGICVLIPLVSVVYVYLGMSLGPDVALDITGTLWMIIFCSGCGNLDCG